MAEAIKPEVREINLDWGKVTSETTEVIATITAYNPNPFSLPVKKVAQFKIPVETDLLAQLGQLGPIPIEKRFKMPVTGEQRTVFKMTIESLSGEWGNITPNITELNLASGETGANYLFAPIILPYSKSDITSKVGLNTMLMDKWFVTHIRQNGFVEILSLWCLKTIP